MEPSLRWMALAVVGFVGCFLASTIYSQLIDSSIDDVAVELSTNSAPSVANLTAARENARLIERRIIAIAPETAAEDARYVRSHLAQMDSSLRQYLALPPYPGEPPQQAATTSEYRQFRAQVEHALEIGGAYDDIARARAADELERTTDEFEGTLDALVDLNTLQVVQMAAEIRRRRIQAARIAYGADALTIVAVAAGTILLLSSGRRARLMRADRSRILEERASELEMFAGRVAHDLRTPLTAIGLRAESARSRAGDRAAVEEGLTRIGVQVGKMAGIIDALLAFARAGARPEPGATCGLGEVVESVFAETQPLAVAAGVALLVEPVVEARPRCSTEMLAIVLSNLVRNAIKFIDAPGHERRVIVRAHPCERGARLEVEDTGPGLPAGVEAHVFEPFVRLPGQGTRSRADGIGLGLATVKRLVDAHGGRVGVVSRPGRGALFWVEMPVA